MFKIRLILSIFFCLFIAILAKLFYIQVINSSDFSADYTKTARISPERGKILDKKYEPLAINQTTYLLYVEPTKMKEKPILVKKLDELLKLGEATVSSRIDPTKQWVAVKGGISPELKKQILDLQFPEIGFQEEKSRFYPEASLAGHLTGFVGKNKDGENVGYFGVEGYYDKDLAGLPGLLKSERDLFGRPIFIGTQDRVAAEDGRDFILTVDKTVQHIIKEKLKKSMEDYKAKEGCVIVANPNTMAILGMVCLPDFDPQTYYNFSEDVFKNGALSNVYEPGSTFKPLVMAAAMEERVLKPDDFFNEDGSREFSGFTIQNWNNKYEGQITMTRILEKSSNIGMMYVGEKLGKSTLYSYLQKYGVGTLTDIDLQGEVPGILRPKSTFYDIDYASASFGQGIAVTPIQLVQSFSSVINGGYLMRPYVVEEVIEGNYRRKRQPKIIRRILSDRTSQIMRKMLISTVAHAEVKWNLPKGYNIGGKTGTAQVAIQGNYDASKTIASFIGFAPGNDPKFIMLVVFKEPGKSSWGSETAAPTFLEIAQELLVYYNVPEDK